MSRRDGILALFDASGFGLEVGPSYNPLLPKSEGFRVETIDYADQAELQRKYAANPTVDASRIEPVDYVSDGRPMRQVIGEEGRYDFILASHVIEHTPDMIGFLRDCESLLKPDGVLVLAVPDKRCCFDVFQRLTSTGEVLDAHRLGRTRPSFGSIFDAVAYGAKQDGAPGWPKGSTGDRQLVHSVEQAGFVARQSEETGRYTDVHVWRFVPSSFELILHDLHAIGAIGLRLDTLQSSDEMLAVLSRSGRGSARSRTELLAAALEEHAYEHVAPLAEQLAAERAHPAIERERDHLAALLADAQAQTERIDAELRAAREEIDALRSSTSWKVTSPLRAVRGLIGN
ncbi:bifunctional 2-polyprenyl-6-hydroxyphenol methylase/3-demethylubiquinol 3-O-methyltransferase UbiG [Aureimonas sp. SK2]|uniref:class I SAM-dependent methyltransferase n=1 Tax=Aureimonas sp. SK2 TaxID=3015992 RepID=UPI002443A605|nr:methyltransferase domain-containing protein [Aureimonas sp. SK2]